MDTAPIKLTSARAWRTYIGGSQIDAIHGIEGSQLFRTELGRGHHGQLPQLGVLGQLDLTG